MPILSDVDGVLFELLLLATPRHADDERDRSQSAKPVDSNSTSGGFPVQLDRLSVANNDDLHHERYAGTGVGVRENGAPGGGVVCPAHVDGLETDQDKNPRPCLLVGAVALLLSEVADVWREMESPLFDSAGGVAGTIKLVARVLRGDSDGKKRIESTAWDETPNTMSGAQNPTAAAHQETCLTRTAVRVSASPSAEVGLATPFAVARPTSTEGGTAAACPPRTRDGRDRRRVHREGSVSGSPCCGGHWGSSRRGRPGSGQWGCAEQLGLLRSTAAGKEKRRPSVPEKADETAPRATILYRGLKLPFRWFRSATVREIDEALRETLGERNWLRRKVWHVSFCTITAVAMKQLCCL